MARFTTRFSTTNLAPPDLEGFQLRNCFQSFTSGPVHCPLEEITVLAKTDWVLWGVGMYIWIRRVKRDRVRDRESE